MSLLLEALKKAEDDMRRRRPAAMSLDLGLPQEAAPRPSAPHSEDLSTVPDLAVDSPPGGQTPFPELSLSAIELRTEPAVSPEPSIGQAAPVLLPDTATSSPMPLGVEPKPPAATAPAVAPSRVPPPQPTPEVRAKAAARLMSAAASGRVPRNSRRPVLLGAAAVLVMVGFGAFWWWAEQQSGRPLVASKPSASPAPASASDPTQTVTALVQAPALQESAPTVSTVTTSTMAVQTSVEPRAKPPAARIAPRLSDVARVERAERAISADQQAAPVTKAAAPTPGPIAAPRSASNVDDLVLRRNPSLVSQRIQQAYVDFQAGRVSEAAQAWKDTLRVDPLQKDAWLGLAVLAHREGRRDEAVAAYRQVLRISPESPEATAALSILTNAASDPVEESRLRDLLARSPNSAMLNSALARMLSAQNRWDEAQPLWFNAHTSAPDDPTHAFNLAVAMDRLRKPSLALAYYRKALDLADGRPAGFDKDTARARVAALSAGSVGVAKP